MGSSDSSTEQIDLLSPGQRSLFDLLSSQALQRLQSGPFQNQLDAGAFGPSDLQQQAFGLASQFGGQPFSQQGQAALDQLLSGRPAFEVTPELTQQRNQLFGQSIAPARAAFQDELRGIQDQLGAAGLGRSGGFGESQFRAAERFGSGLGAQRAGILQNDITAGIRSQELARQGQLAGLGIEQQGRQFGLGALGQFGGLQRQISGQQAGVDFANRARQDPFTDPALNTILFLLGQRTFGFQQQQGEGSGLGSLIGGGIGALGGAAFGMPGLGFSLGSSLGGQFG